LHTEGILNLITHVSCRNPECSNYGAKKAVVSAEILGMNPKVCPACGSAMKVAKQINVSGGRGGKRGSKRM